MRTALCPLALLLSPVPSLATDLEVTPAGGGAPFATIGAAVAAAQPGDNILVAAGTYPGFVVDKAVWILGSDKGPIFVQASKASGVRVQSIPAGATAFLADLRVLPASPGPVAAAALIDVDSNAGTVVLQNIVASQSGGVGFAAASLRINATARALVIGCTIAGFDAPAALPDTAAGPGGPGLLVTLSDLSINDSSIRGGAGAVVFPGAVKPPAGAGLLASDASLRLGRARIFGGKGAVVLSGTDIQGGAGAPGALLSGSTLSAAGGPGNVLQGGAGGGASAAGGPGLRLLAGSAAELGSDVVAKGGGLAPGVSTDGSSSSTVLPSELPSISATPSASGTSFTLSIAGEPGVVQAVFMSLALGPPISFANIIGQADLAFGSLTLLAVGVPGNQVVPVLPPMPGVNGLTFYGQSVQLGSLWALSNPSVLTQP